MSEVMRVSNSLMPAAAGLPSPVSSVDAYIARVTRIPVLDAQEEQDLARRLRDDDDLVAAQQLILSNLRFVVHIARGYAGYGLALGDLIQEGNIGLMKAVRRFDPDYGVRLVSFAVHWIRAEIHEFILRNWRIVKVATTKAQRKLFFHVRSAKKRLGWFSSEELDAVANDLGVSRNNVQEMESRLAGQDIAFDPYAGEDSEDEGSFAPAQYLPDHSMDPAQHWEHEDWESDSRERLQKALGELDGRSRDIVMRRWIAEDKATLQELAAEYDVSAERIRQLENNALKKLRRGVAA